MNYEKNFNQDIDNNNDNNNNNLEFQQIHTNKKISQLKKYQKKFHNHCKLCLKHIKLPIWLSKLLLWIYTHLSSIFTYGLFLLAIYACIISIKPSIALPPQCRFISIIKRIDQLTNNSMNDNQFSGNKFEKALECRHGEALSILIFYGFGFMFGEIMELLHLPGLLGMFYCVIYVIHESF
ncbi:uncharacterized protein DC041_0008171 [Schistosoma bovis]|uniref:Uncharacterized protein n=1 Tax=Schistosoma bovis TaxID=6184 RepID=A0A430Q905_SCHBO|nr:uncharacterized protein DC041_0008171 [Schistosoma bovis]